MVVALGISFLILICALNKKSEIKITEEIYKEEFKAEADSQQESVSIELHYPQISGLNNPEKEKRINNLIKEDIFEILEHKPLIWPDYWFIADTNVSEVKFVNDKVISICYKGDLGYISPGHGCDSFARATTIDIEQERILTLDDVISDFDTLNTLLLNNEFENITEWEGVKGTYPFNDSYIIRPAGWQISKQNRSWYTDGEEFVILETSVIYNEYSKNIQSMNNIFKKSFIDKIK